MTLQTEAPPSSDETPIPGTRSIKKDTYGILLTPLFEAKQTLQVFSSAYPSSGLDAWTLGYRLSAMVDMMLQWSLWFHGPAEQETPALDLASSILDTQQDGSLDPLWQRLEENWSKLAKICPKDGVFHPEMYPSFPLQLRAYCARHRALMLPVLEEYGENDMELQEILTPTLALHQHIESNVVRWVRQQPGMLEPQPWWRRWGFWAVAAILFLGYNLYSQWNTPKPPPKQVGLPAGSLPGGIIGAYYNGSRFQTLKQKRIDKNIWFHWQSSPASGVDANQFSIRWSGYVRADKKGVHKFCIHHDDGAYVYVGSQTLINKWKKMSPNVQCQSLPLSKGWHRLIVQMNEQSGSATAKLSWQPPGAKNPRKIESKNLCCRNR